MRRLILLLFFYGSMPLFYLDPFYGIIHYTLINIIRPEQLLWGSRGLFKRIFLFSQVNIFFAWFINKDSRKLTPEDTPVPFQIKLLCVIAITMLISMIFGIAPKAWSWRWTSQFMKGIVFCFVMAKSINSARKLEQYYTISVAWMMLLQLWGIQQKLAGNARMEGLGGLQLSDVNDLASVAVLYFPMAYYTLFSNKKWLRLFVGVPTTIVSVIFILFGGSRGAFLGLMTCVAFILIRQSGFLQRIKTVFTTAIVGVLIVFVLKLIAPPGFFDEYTARLQTIQGVEDQSTGEVDRGSSSEGRLAMWKASYYFFLQHPEFWLTGVGTAGFSLIYFNYIDELEPYLSAEEYHHVLFKGSGGKAIHNSYINIATGGGILTFFPWFFLLLYAWAQAHTIPRKYPKIVEGVNIHNYALAVEVGLVGASVSAAFINAEFVDFYYWHLIMAGVIANIGKAKLQREASGIEDEEFIEETIGKPFYSGTVYS